VTTHHVIIPHPGHSPPFHPPSQDGCTTWNMAPRGCAVGRLLTGVAIKTVVPTNLYFETAYISSDGIETAAAAATTVV